MMVELNKSSSSESTNYYINITVYKNTVDTQGYTSKIINKLTIQGVYALKFN